MPALTPTQQIGEIVWIGTVAEGAGLRSTAADMLDMSYAGPKGEAHSGLTRPSCVRVKAQWPKGTEIRNVRIAALIIWTPRCWGARWWSKVFLISAMCHRRRGCNRRTAQRLWWICKTAPAICPRARLKSTIRAMANLSKLWPRASAA